LTASDLNTLVVQAAPGSSRTLHIGSGSGTTDASGYLTITHGAGFTPSVVICFWSGQGLGGGPTGVYGTDTYGSTTFRARWGGVSSATAVNYVYVCLA
jgi:hypothetical protein